MTTTTERRVYLGLDETVARKAHAALLYAAEHPYTHQDYQALGQAADQLAIALRDLEHDEPSGGLVRACRINMAHEPHGTCLGTAPEYPSEVVLTAEEADHRCADLVRTTVAASAKRIRQRSEEAAQTLLDHDHPAQPSKMMPVWECTGHHSVRRGAKPEDYPLSGTCTCGEPVYLASSDADWTHRWEAIRHLMPRT